MLIVDSSAVIAILFEEPEGPACMRVLDKGSRRLISAVNYVEAGTVLAGRLVNERRGKLIDIVDEFLVVLGIDITPLDDTLARIALKARIDFGKGFGTRGGLNFGDCFAYALAKRHSAPLLYVGDDFALTDVQSALSR